MTEQQFRARAEAAIRNGAALFGAYFVDANDRSVYCVTRWVNAPSIAFDQYFPHEHPEWPQEYRRAALSTDTLWYPHGEAPR